MNLLHKKQVLQSMNMFCKTCYDSFYKIASYGNIIISV